MSFSQNLFLVVREVRGGGAAGEKSHEESSSEETGSQFIAVVVSVCYLQCLLVAPETVGSWALFPMLFATRLLLLSPILVVWMSRRKQHSQKRYGLVMRTRDIIILVIALWMSMEGWSPWWPGSIGEAVDALHVNAAVSALGYDLVIGVSSLVVRKLLEYV